MLPSIEFLALMEVPDSHTQYVISIDGEILPKRRFRCSLEKSLSERLWDLEYVSLIVDHFENIIEKELKHDPEAIDLFKKWIVKNCYILPIGSKKSEKELEKHTCFKHHIDPIHKFLKAVNMARPLTDHKIKKIAIIIPSGNQGEKSIAEAIKTGLSSEDREIQIIWPRPEADLLYQFAHLTTDDVWGKIWQQMNNHHFAVKCWNINHALRNFLPNDTLGDLRRRVHELNPDFIISTYYNFPSHAILATCPMAIMHCDFYFNPRLQSLAQIADKQRVKIWVPAESNVPKDLRDRVDIVGYPLRPEIYRASEEEVALFRQNWNIFPHEKVIMMQMGRQGIGGKILPKLVHDILSYPKKYPALHFVIVTGENQALYAQLQHLLENMPKRKDIQIQIHKALTGTQMNELYNLASLMIGKAGGVTTAEIIHMGVYGIVFASWHLEKHNVQHLISLDLGEEFNPEKNIVPILLKALKKPRRHFTPIDWKETIAESLTN